MARHRRWVLFVVVPCLMAVPRSAFAQSADASPAPPTANEPPTAAPAPDAAHLTVVLDPRQRLSVIHRDAQGNVVWTSTIEDSDPIAALLLTLLLTTSVPHERATPTSREPPRTPSRPTLPAVYEPPDARRRREHVDQA